MPDTYVVEFFERRAEMIKRWQENGWREGIPGLVEDTYALAKIYVNQGHGKESDISHYISKIAELVPAA